MKFFTNIFAALVICSCVNLEEGAEPTNIVAVPISAKYSGWDIDHCAGLNNEEVECISHGGQIYVVDLKNVKGIKLQQLLVVQHALLVPIGNEERWCFSIELASEKLVETTGVNYIAYQHKRGC